MAISAGIDVCLVCQSPQAQAEAAVALLGACEKGNLTEQRIDRSLERILRLKKQFLAQHKPAPLDDLAGIIGCRAHRHVVELIHGKTHVAG